MSVFLLTQGNPLVTHTYQQPLLPTLHVIMISDFRALPLQMGHYRTFLERSSGQLQLLWRFEPMKNGCLRVCIRPNFSDGQDGNFRIDTQRGLVDLLRAISGLNRDKNRTMNFMVTQHNYVELMTIYPAQYLKNINYLRRIIKVTFSHLGVAIDNLMNSIQPFLESNKVPLMEESVNNTAKRFWQKSKQLLQLSKYNQLESRRKKARKLKPEEPDEHEKEEIEQLLQAQRVQACKKIKDCLIMMGVDSSILKNSTKSIVPSYSQWLNRKKEDPYRDDQDRNVFGVKILAQTAKQVEKDISGSHCSILLGTFKLIIVISLNAQVNKSIEEMRSNEGLPLVTQKETEMELVKKQVKNIEKLQSKNSFQNELDFIKYIKDRSCQFVSTYYWQFQLKRQKMSTILMDYYPHNMEEMLSTQGKLLSFREKLVLLQRITIAVNWLANNQVCHRDLKPSNIMINEKRVPKLVDFGSCCPVSGTGTNFQVSQTRLLGTYGYFRPYDEKILGYAYKKQEYQQHMLFDAYSISKIMLDIFKEGLPNLLPNMESLMSYMIDRCQQADPADRLTYQEMLFLFENFLQYLDQVERNLNYL